MNNEKYAELVRNPDVKIERVEGYGDYEFFSTGDVYSHKTNKFLGLTAKGGVSPNIYLYNTEGRINFSRSNILGKLFLDKTSENQNIVRQKVKGNDYSIDNLEWAVMAEVSAKNIRAYLDSVKVALEVNKMKKAKVLNVKVEDEAIEATLKKPTPFNAWLVLFSILAVVAAYKITR